MWLPEPLVSVGDSFPRFCDSSIEGWALDCSLGVGAARGKGILLEYRKKLNIVTNLKSPPHRVIIHKLLALFHKFSALTKTDLVQRTTSKHDPAFSLFPHPNWTLSSHHGKSEWEKFSYFTILVSVKVQKALGETTPLVNTPELNTDSRCPFIICYCHSMNV